MIVVDALLAALRIKAGADCACRVEVTPWCSVDRSGERHVFDLAFEDRSPVTRLLTDLNDHEFDLPDAFVAEIHACAHVGVEFGGAQVRVEALTFSAD